MIWRRAILAACAAAAIAPTAAVAQPIFVESNGPVGKVTSIPVRITGLLSVQFHGDPAAGCARWGLCGYSGTVSWQPPPAASLQIVRTLGRHPHVEILLFPTLSGGPQVDGGTTTASVAPAGTPASGPASRCVDATPAGQGALFAVRHGHVTVSLARESAGLLVTRCAGPRDADVLPYLPSPTVPVATLERGDTEISLAVSHPLDAHGFAGSITSTIVLHLGRPGRPRTEKNTASRGETKPGREIDVTYRATLDGSVVEEIRGAADPLECGPVGACGLTGTTTLAPHVESARATLIVDARTTTPRQEMLAAAGLGPGSPGGVTGTGVVSWRGGGSVLADLSQGSERCRDTAPFGGGGLLITTGHGQWRARVFPGGLLETSTRCAGPILSAGTIASNAAPLSSLDRRITRIALTSGSATQDDGYRVRIVPYLTLTLTRLRVRTKTIRIVTGGSAGPEPQTR
ncbi:MAG TPA: hypothetical protein VHW96_24380 [Solirubrobacteraceae bacterium]|jgi:hypothetical protein|nr:hypothetical protein [Solirubrobacteraceae bacterium]